MAFKLLKKLFPLNDRKLSLENNDLRGLPETMVNFAALEELNLGGNLFESD